MYGEPWDDSQEQLAEKLDATIRAEPSFSLQLSPPFAFERSSSSGPFTHSRPAADTYVMSAKWVLWGGVVLVVAALAAGVVEYASSGSPHEGKPDRRSIPDHEYPRLTRAMMRYEDLSASLAFDYRDEKVSASEWLQISSARLPKMVSGLSHIESRLAGSGERHATELMTFARLSRDEVEALFELRDAIRGLDAAYETYAWDHWARAADRKYHFLSGYYGRHQGLMIDFGSILPSIPLKSLA